MYLKNLFLTIILLGCGNVFAQDDALRKLEFDIAVGFYSFSTADYNATNSIIWISDPGGYVNSFSGYGTSILPAFDLAYYFSDNIGISLGFSPVEANNKQEIGEGDDYLYVKNKFEQYRITPGLAVRHSPNRGGLILGMKTGFVIAPYYISEEYESGTGSDYYYLNGDGTAGGFFIEGGFKVRIFKFLYLKSEINHNFIRTGYNMYESDGNYQIDYKDMNMGGTTLKAGFSFTFL